MESDSDHSSSDSEFSLSEVSFLLNGFQKLLLSFMLSDVLSMCSCFLESEIERSELLLLVVFSGLFDSLLIDDGKHLGN